MKVFFDVDTQVDFMMPRGKLYVGPAALEALPVLKKLTSKAVKQDIMILGEVDRHFKDDKELARNGGPYPDHCMDGTSGQHKIAETLPDNPLFIENRRYGRSEVEDLVNGNRWLYLEKQSLDVFTNPNTETVLNMLGVTDAVVYGVVTELCVDVVVCEFVSRGIDVTVIEDAVCALDRTSARKAVENWKEKGVAVIKMADANL